MIDSAISHGDAELLLPWYVNGTLGETESRSVQGHLDACVECRESLALLQRMQRAVNEEHAIPIVPKPRLAALYATIDGGAQRKLSPWFGNWRLAAVLAAMAVVPTAIWLYRTSGDADPAMYETATAAGEAALVGYVMDVRLQPGLDDAEREAVLRSIGAREAVYDAGTDRYRIVVELPGGSLAALEGFTSALRDRPQVESAEVIALQLPVRTEP